MRAGRHQFFAVIGADEAVDAPAPGWYIPRQPSGLESRCEVDDRGARGGQRRQGTFRGPTASRIGKPAIVDILRHPLALQPRLGREPQESPDRFAAVGQHHGYDVLARGVEGSELGQAHALRIDQMLLP